MTIDQWRQVKEIFEASLEREPSARAQFIAEQSGGDDAIRLAAEQMLRDFDESGDFLEEAALVEFGLDNTQFDPGYEQGRRIGPYRIVSEIGQGGMGAVYLAERADDAYEKRVAIKMVWPGGIRSEINRRFNIERRVLAALEHPNIARLLDGGVTEDGWSYVVMEYVDGVPITEYCAQRKLSIAERLRLFQSVCEAVQYAHQHLIVHRDLKPSNILVTHAGEVKLLDFGIAKILDPTDDASGQSPTLLNFLTPEYASPEHIAGQRITTASDVYSLGVLLYELLTGARPFNPTSRSPQELIRLIETHEPARPSQVSVQLDAAARKQLRGDLDNIILKALQKEPLRRYQSARQFSEDIARHLNGEPVIAREATLAYRLGKRLRRNKALTVGLTLFVLALITGLIVTRSQLLASQARERQQQYELYAADMRQAGSDWGEGNLVQMGELLERHRPGNGIDDEWRGFEWFALWKLLHTEKFTLHHQSQVPVVRFTPDGKTILTGSEEGLAMWDATNGRSLGIFDAQYPGLNVWISDDGKRLLALSQNNSIRLWDYANRRAIANFPTAANTDPWFAVSPDGKKVAININKHPIRVRDMDTGQLAAEYVLPAGLERISDDHTIYSPSGRLYILTRRQRHLELWDVEAGRTSLRLDPQSDDPSALIPYAPVGYIFSRDGRRLYLPTRDFLIRAYDTQSGKLLQVFRGHQDNIETPTLSFDDKLLATGSDDRTLRLWDTQTGELLVTIRNESQTFSPVFSPDDKFLAAVCMRALRVKVWDVQKLLSEPNTLNEMRLVEVSPDLKTKLTDRYDSKSPALRDMQTGQPFVFYEGFILDSFPHNYCVRFSPDGKLFTIRAAPAPKQPTSMIEIRAITDGKLIARLTGHTTSVMATAFTPDGKTLATADESGVIKFWNTATWQEYASLHLGASRIPYLEFSPDGRRLLICNRNSVIQIWDVASRKHLLNLRGHRGWAMYAKYSPDGKLIASASWDYTVKLWDAATGQALRTLKGHANSVYAVAFSPDGKRLASASDDATVRIWDVQTGTELTALRGHTGKVWRVAFSHDGQALLSSDGKETRIWRASTEEEVQRSYAYAERGRLARASEENKH